MNQKEIYNLFWEKLDLQKPQSWSTWKIVKDFQEKKILELGPGNYPKTPIQNGFFIDISERAVENLRKIGANAQVGDAINLSFENDFFDLIVAIEVLEHIENDKKAVSEITRVLKPSGFFLFSVPMRMDLFSEFDSIVGHERRYEIESLISLLSSNGFEILKFRQPSSYSKTINNIARITGLKEIYFKTGAYKKMLNSSRSLANFYSSLMAFFDKKGAPEWRADIESLAEYKDDSIVIFCQKI